RKTVYNYPQLPYDPHEWDYDSWSWTEQQAQRMKWGDPSPHHSSLAAVTYDSWIFANRVVGMPGSFRQKLRAILSERLRPYPAVRERLKKVYHLVSYASGYGHNMLHVVRRNGVNREIAGVVPDELGRDPRVYRDNA